MILSRVKLLSFILLPIIITLSLWLLKYAGNPFPNFITTLQLISGLSALTLFVQTILLSSRLSFMEKLMGGYDTLYFYHKYLSITATLLAVVHYTTYLIKKGGYPIAEIQANFFSLEPYEIGLKLGVLSFYSIILLIVITYIKRVPYHIWKATHNYMGLFFILASVHAVMIGRDLQLISPLTLWVLTISIIGAAAFVYIRFFWSMSFNSFEYQVDSITKLELVTEISLVPKTERLDFKAGQFVFLSFNNKNIGNEVHPYTISSAPHEDKLRFSIKNLGDYTNKLSLLSKGDSAKIRGPHGSFGEKFLSQNKPMTWIAGGIGVTPFLSMLRHCRIAELSQPIDFWYLVKTPQEAIYENEIQFQISNLSNKNLTLHTKYSTTQGYTTAKNIVSNYVDYKNRYYFICGPAIMMRIMIDDLIELGVSKHYIISEDFSFKA